MPDTDYIVIVEGEDTGVSSVVQFTPKGSVTSKSLLPLSGNTKGDTYVVTEDGSKWFWDSDSSSGDLDDYTPVTTVAPSSEYAPVSSVPAAANVGSTGLMTFSNSSGSSLFTVQLPLYAGGVE